MHKICVIHDSQNCFEYLNPEFSDNDPNYAVYLELAKEYGSENILKTLEKEKLFNMSGMSGFSLYASEECPVIRY